VKWNDIDANGNKEFGDTIIVSRAIYTHMGDIREPGILSEKRLKLMQKYFINSLRNQTDQNFTLYLVVGSRDNETTKLIELLDWGGLVVKFLYTNGELNKWKDSISRSRNWGAESADGCPEVLTRESGHPMTRIMARLDTDDWVAPGWIAHMKHMAKTKPERNFLINYQVIGQYDDGRLYNFSDLHAHARTSPFMALVQSGEVRISPYCDTHLRMGSKFPVVYTIPPSYAFMVLHEGNRSNRLYKNDSFIEEIRHSKSSVTSTTPTKLTPKYDEDIKGSDWKSRISINANGRASRPS
jgi:hypothetical protein